MRVAGGVLTIITGAIVVILSIWITAVGAAFFFWGGGVALALGILGLILGVMGIVGGGYACSGRNFGLWLAGAICATIAAIIILSPLLALAIPGLVFIPIRRGEFV
jgi:hypothetical protein